MRPVKESVDIFRALRADEPVADSPRALIPVVVGRTLLLLAAFMALAPVAARPVEFGDPMRGQDIFAGKGCVRCHAVRGAGGRIGPDLGRHEVGDSFVEIVAQMWNHSPAMRQKMSEYRLTHPRLTGSQLRDLVSFLYLLRYFDEPGDPTIGEMLFSSKGCDHCHRVGEAGASAGLRLDDYPRNTSPLRIAQDLWNHGPEMISQLRRDGTAPPKFEPIDGLDLFAYLRSQGPRRQEREFATPGDPERGVKLFDSKGCSRCHAVFGKGGDFAHDLGRARMRGSVTQIAVRMWNHWTLMAAPMRGLEVPYPRFEGDELADLLAYVFLVRFEGLEGDSGRGEVLYRERRCSDCHGSAGEGFVGPALREITPDLTTEAIVQSMWNHVPQMRTQGLEQDIPWPRLSSEELGDLLAFLSEEWPLTEPTTRVEAEGEPR